MSSHDVGKRQCGAARSSRLFWLDMHCKFVSLRLMQTYLFCSNYLVEPGRKFVNPKGSNALRWNAILGQHAIFWLLPLVPRRRRALCEGFHSATGLICTMLAVIATVFTSGASACEMWLEDWFPHSRLLTIAGLKTSGTICGVNVELQVPIHSPFFSRMIFSFLAQIFLPKL